MKRFAPTQLAMLSLAILFGFAHAEQAAAQVTQNPYYFGMSVRIVRSYDGCTSLQVTTVTPGGPAQRAGLEPGDQIQKLNGQGFSMARDNYEAVRMMNYFVDAGGYTDPGVPAAPAAAAAAQNQSRVLINPGIGQPTAQMLVRDVRTGQSVYLTVNPALNQTFPGGPPAPAAASSPSRTMVQPQTKQPASAETKKRPWNR